MTTRKNILTHSLTIGLIYPFLVVIIGGIVFHYWQSNHESKINNENSQSSQIRILQHWRDIDSMKHIEIDDRLKRLERKVH